VPRVRPFRAWTYARSDADISTLCAPPYDVISEEQRRELLGRDPHNVVALELPEGTLDPEIPGNRYETGAVRWKEWRDQGVLVRDTETTLYVLEQRYTRGGTPIRRRAFIAEVKLHAFDEGIVLPHERTLPKALGDRYRLTEATAANLSQVFGLYQDPDKTTGVVFERAMGDEPVMRATDADGVESVVWAVTDPALIATLTESLADSRIFIADGHHRYTVALAYRDMRRGVDAAAGRTLEDPDYDYVMMALVNMDDPDLVVLPTHRVADAPQGLEPSAFYEALAAHFVISDPEPGDPARALDGHDRPAFLVKTRADTEPRLAVLRKDVDLDTVIPAQRSRAWKELDVTVLLELVLDPMLDIHPDRPETLERLHFVKDAHETLAMASDHDAVFVVRPTRMDQMRAVSLAGDVMPQKSTYFYPKLLSGLVLRGMDQD
jgi:uncharacterized protein (DUF1015 family)